MAGMGGRGMTLALATMGQEQAQRQAASYEQAKLQKQRADILASRSEEHTSELQSH